MLFAGEQLDQELYQVCAAGHKLQSCESYAAPEGSAVIFLGGLIFFDSFAHKRHQACVCFDDNTQCSLQLSEGSNIFALRPCDHHLAQHAQASVGKT